MGQARCRWNGPSDAYCGRFCRLLATLPCQVLVRQTKSLELLFGRDRRVGQSPGKVSCLVEREIDAEFLAVALGAPDSDGDHRMAIMPRLGFEEHGAACGRHAHVAGAFETYVFHVMLRVVRGVPVTCREDVSCCRAWAPWRSSGGWWLGSDRRQPNSRCRHP